MQDPASINLVLRHLELASSLKGRLTRVIIDPPSLADARALHEGGSAVISRQFLGFRDAQIGYRCDVPNQEEPAVAIVFLPKGKELLRMTLRNLAHALAPGSEILVVGEKDAGIQSAGKVLSELFEAVQKCAYGGHRVLWSAQHERKRDWSLNSEFRSWTISALDLPLAIESLPGVFSSDSLDPGTKMLLDVPP